ncbi:MAG: alpha/beta fold hydrolase [Candidatus Kerfeldbacteria bacterium]|nr:alpha/beta fold hydrolase [Candidatus Kerfeldbacteria bacterium]
MALRNNILIICGCAFVVVCIVVGVIVHNDGGRIMITHQLIGQDGEQFELREFARTNARIAVILLPNSSQSQSELFSIAQQFQNEGFATMTIDWRGHADGSNARFSSSEWSATAYDVDAAVGFTQHKYPKAKIVLAGGSFGAVQSIAYAATHSDISGVIALSPRPAIHGVSIALAITQLTKPILVIEYHPVDDTTTQFPGYALLQTSPSTKKTYQAAITQASGWNVVIDQEDVIRGLIDWIKQNI